MQRSRRPAPAIWLLTLAAVVGTSACQRWVTVEQSPVEGMRVVKQEKVLVVMKSGERVQLAAPIRVEGDSLSGRGRHERPSSWPDRIGRLGIALADISEIRVERRDHTATGVSFGAVALTVFVVGGLIGLAIVGVPFFPG
ncbi:MAG: hypothetical protein ACODAB_03155 [Gemmatimonadota bacterium]